MNRLLVPRNDRIDRWRYAGDDRAGATATGGELRTLTLILFGLGALLAYAPEWSRPNLYFGVTVETGIPYAAEGRRVLRLGWLKVALIVWRIESSWR